MKYSPSNETITVLLQAGYDNRLINKAIDEFSQILLAYPDLIKPTDKEFYAHLKIRNIKKSYEIESNFDAGTAWRPGVDEMKRLESEGYWEEIINDLLGDFIFRPQSDGLVISKFALFRAYLRKKYPLHNHNINEWRPDSYLLKLIELRMFLREVELEKIYPHFRKSVLTKQVPGTRIPRYFFNYVKRNKEKLSGSAIQARSWAYSG